MRDTRKRMHVIGYVHRSSTSGQYSQVTVPIADDGAPKLNTGALIVLLAAGLVWDMAAAGKAPKDSTGPGAGLDPASALERPPGKKLRPMTPSPGGSAGFGWLKMLRARLLLFPVPKLNTGSSAAATLAPASAAFVLPNVWLAALGSIVLHQPLWSHARTPTQRLQRSW